jgi:hypothetical protein
VVVAMFGVLLLKWHAATELSVVPYHDGSHHVANVASLLAEIRMRGLGYFGDFVARSPSDALTYGLLALVSAVVGPGRFAFGVAWLLCLVAITLGFLLYFRSAQMRAASVLALAILLFSRLFQSPLGGAWDTRVDLLAATIGVLSLLCLLKGKLFAASMLVVVAAFAKGAAAVLLLPLVALGVALLGVVQWHAISRPSWRLVTKSVLVVGFAWLFATRIGPQTVSYNLMATGGSSLQQRLQLFIVNSVEYVTRDPWFYLADLGRNYYGAWLAAAVLLATAFLAWRGRRSELRLALFAVSTMAYTTLLMTISPLHANVLTIWYLPALAVVTVFVARVVARLLPAAVTVALSGLLLLPTLLPLAAPPKAPSAEYAPYVADLLGQASEMAESMDSEHAARSSEVVVLVNFLWADGPLFYNYDVFRVLMHERLRHANLAIDGWELGTFGKNWMPELLSQQKYPEVLFVLQSEPRGISAGDLVRDYMNGFQRDHPECLTPTARPIETKGGGQQVALRLSATNACRDALFGPRASG